MKFHHLFVSGMLTLMVSNIVYAQLAWDAWSIYRGNTHAHTLLTNSHGQHLSSSDEGVYFNTNYRISQPLATSTLVNNWFNYQDMPERHFKMADSVGFDFYATTDHSQEEPFFPIHPYNTAWILAHRQADVATKGNFVALVGVEHSENDGTPSSARGHINVINSADYLNALAIGTNLPEFYTWLQSAQPYGGQGQVVAQFNHPSGPKNFNNFEYQNDAVRDIITLIELLNNDKSSNDDGAYEDGFRLALNAGWRVSPTSGMDNHGTPLIISKKARTCVLAQNNSKTSILDAMRKRRTYATLETNLNCWYSVNNMVMGSTLSSPTSMKFRFKITDPDTGNPADKITKIEIMSNESTTPVYSETVPNGGSHSVDINTTPININSTTSKWYYIRVYNAGGGDASNPVSTKPVAWLAPIWTGR